MDIYNPLLLTLDILPGLKIKVFKLPFNLKTLIRLANYLRYLNPNTLLLKVLYKSSINTNTVKLISNFIEIEYYKNNEVNINLLKYLSSR